MDKNTVLRVFQIVFLVLAFLFLVLSLLCVPTELSVHEDSFYFRVNQGFLLFEVFTPLAFVCAVAALCFRHKTFWDFLFPILIFAVVLWRYISVMNEFLRYCELLGVVQ